jgi:hypothetical protein
MQVLIALALCLQDRSPFSQKPVEKKQEAPADASPHKSLSYYKNYEKSMEYLLANYSKVEWPTAPAMWAGMVFFLDGREELKPHFEAVVKRAIHNCRLNQLYNRNWFVCYSALFLAVVYQKDPRPEIKAALEEAVKSAEASQEKTGGWNHHGGMGMDPNYYRTGGAHDIAFLTATMLSVLLIVQKSGIEVPQPMIDRAHDNLKSLVLKGGIQYGTGNRSPDFALCRVAAAYIGLKFAGQTSSPICSAASALPERVAKTQDAHAYGPTNFLSAAIAMQLMGSYATFGNHWLPKIAATQQPDGTVRMLNDGTKDNELPATRDRVSSAAVFCLMVLMQKHKLLEAPKPAGPAKNPSPFTQKK